MKPLASDLEQERPARVTRRLAIFPLLASSIARGARGVTAGDPLHGSFALVCRLS
jgi:hypothetical protein